MIIVIIMCDNNLNGVIEGIKTVWQRERETDYSERGIETVLQREVTHIIIFLHCDLYFIQNTMC